MAYREQLADRLRIALDPTLALQERRMFGGLIFLLRGSMLCGTSNDDFMFRAGAERMDEALRQGGARPIRLGAHAPMTGFVWVASGAVAGNRLDLWLDWCLDFQNNLD